MAFFVCSWLVLGWEMSRRTREERHGRAMAWREGDRSDHKYLAYPFLWLLLWVGEFRVLSLSKH